MFTDTITATPFTDNIADTVCSSIFGTDYMGDMSFIATARALLMPRMTDGDKLKITYNRNGWRKETIQGASVQNVINAILPDLDNDHLHILELTRDKEDNEFIINYIIEHIGEYRNVRRIDKVTQFYQKTFNVVCYVDEEKRHTYLITDRLTMRFFHYLQCGILIYLPWFFKKEDGISPEERALIESLRLNDSVKYQECLAEIAKHFDFREKYTRKALAGLEIQVEKDQLESIKSAIESQERDLEDYYKQISRLMRALRDNNTKMIGLEYKIREWEDGGCESEIMNYFLKNDRLYLRSAEYGEFVFDVKDYLMFWDEEMAEKMFDNNRSYAYNPGREVSVPYSKEEMKNLLREIFVNGNFKMRVCATYKFSIHDMRVSALRGINYGYEFSDCTPNPHLDRYSCLGNNEQAINDFLKNRDYIGAIEQCIASCRSLNFGDGAVMQEFFQRWYGVSYSAVNMKCIELPNGEVVTPVDAIKYMKEQAEDAQESEVTDGKDN